jgi:hypothetical protein
MGTREFISHLVASVAWPVTVFVCLLVLRKPLLDLLPLVRKLKYSDIEVQFGREVAEIRVAADAAELRSEPETLKNAGVVWESLFSLALVRPRSAIREAWRQVESTLERIAKSRNLQAAPAVWSMPMILGALMLNEGLISQPQFDLLNRIRILAGEAEHAPTNTLQSDDAADFVALALRLSASLSGDRGSASGGTDLR